MGNSKFKENENEIKRDLSDFVKNCIIAGDGREYLIALVSLNWPLEFTITFIYVDFEIL